MKTAIIAILGLLAVVGVWTIGIPWWSSRAEWRTPIRFYGKVVDENQSAVPGTQVELSCNDLSFAGTSIYHRFSDSNGLFSISKIRGKLLVVNVTKDGCYTSRADNNAFYYAGENVNFIPNSAKPEVFHLRHIGVAEPLIHIQSPLGGGRCFTIDTNGLPLELLLSSGAVVGRDQGDLRVECWTKQYPGNWKFDWRCRITVVGGGLQRCAEEFPFQAPLEGYASSDEIDMPISLGEKWSNSAKRNYFVRLANGKYARIYLEIIPSGDHFISLDSYLNPSGSRNLEFDPNKVLQATN